MIRYVVVIFLTMAIYGCGQGGFLGLGDHEETTKITSKIKEKRNQDFDGSLRTEYPSGSNQSLTLHASGNAKIDVRVPSVSSDGRVIWETSQRNSMREDIEESFSIDKWVKNVSTAGWALLALCASVFLVTLWFFLKHTIAGKAADAALGASIDFAKETACKLNDSLRDMAPGSDEWKAANAMYGENDRKLQDFLSKQKPGKR